MIDGQGRNIDYIRISLTDRCNLRCIYCMPEEGVPLMRHEDILSFDEILRICRILAEEGFCKVKLTGGEPLVRRNSAGLLRELKAIPGIRQVTLTTNGILLKDQMKDLVDAGLDAVNISLDTLDPEEFARITRRDELQKVLDGIEEALRYPQVVVKLNCVPVASDRENLIRMAELAKNSRLHVRFIEVMPLGEGKTYSAWNEDSMLEVLEHAFGKAEPFGESLGNGPGHYYSFAGFQGKIGFISAVSHKFCERCNRIRLTSDGYLKACLQYQAGADLKTPLRSGCGDAQLRETIREVLRKKPVGHNFFEEKTDVEEARIMAQIGG